MTKELSGVVAEHIRAVNAFDIDAIVATFAEDAYVNDNRREIVGIEAIRLQVRIAVARELAENWIDGLPPEEIGISAQRTTGTTAAEVQTAAKKYFPAYQTAIVAVGDEKVIRESLSPFGLPIKTIQ